MKVYTFSLTRILFNTSYKRKIPITTKKRPIILCIILLLFNKELSLVEEVTAKVKIIYQDASTNPAIRTKYALNTKSLLFDMN